MTPRRGLHCGQNEHNSRTCPNRAVRLFGVLLTDGVTADGYASEDSGQKCSSRGREHNKKGPRAIGRGACGADRKKAWPHASVFAAPMSTGSSEWAKLPQGPLLLVVNRLPAVADRFAVAAVCHSWRSIAGPPTSAMIGGCRPPLLLSPIMKGERWKYPRCCHLLSPADPAASRRCLLPFGTLAHPVIGYSHGHLISCCSRRPLLINVATGDVVRAPELPLTYRLQHGILTAPPSVPGCNLLLLCCYQRTTGSYLHRWGVGESEWSNHYLGPSTMFMNRITVFRGQIFILDLHGWLFTVKFSPCFHVTKLLEVRPWPILDLMELIECDGELMLVRFVYAREMPCSTVKVEVFQLDLSGPPSWVKMESLGEKTLFIDIEHGSSASCPNPSRWGGRSNCIYLALRALGTWTMLPLDGKFVHLDHPKLQRLERARSPSMKWPAPIWVFPSMRS